MKHLGSIKLSLFLFLLYAAAAGAATFIEARFGTETAWALVYGAWWFAAVQLALGVNLFAALIAYKMSARPALFALHLSFLFMLLGAGITRFAGFEGTLHLREGTSSRVVASARKFLSLREGAAEASEAIYLSRLGANYAAVAQSGLKLELLGLIAHAKKRFISSEDGQPVAVLAAASEHGMREFALQNQGFINVADVVISQNYTPKMSVKTLHIRPHNAHAHASANFDFELINPANYESKIIAAGSEIMLKEGEILSFSGVKLSALQLLSGAQEIYEASDDESLPDALAVRLSDESGAHVGGYLHEGEPALMRLNGREITAYYGAKLLELPFSVRLDEFKLERYALSSSPKSYESFITLSGDFGEKKAHIFMNNVLDFGGMRFFQTSYDKDLKGSILSINRDPGKLPTYIGYALLALGLAMNLLDPRSRFRKLARELSRMAGVFICAMMLYAWGATPAQAMSDISAANSHNGDVVKIDTHGREENPAKNPASSDAKNPASSDAQNPAADQKAAPPPGGEKAVTGKKTSAQNLTSSDAKNPAADQKSSTATAAHADDAERAIAAAIARAKAQLAAVSRAEHARALETLAVRMSNNRIAPFGVQARAVLSKIAHRASFDGQSAAEVLLRLASEPEFARTAALIYQPNAQIAKLLGTSERRVNFAQLFGAKGYLIAQQVNEAARKPAAQRSAYERELLKFDERANVLFMAAQGMFFTAFEGADGTLDAPRESADVAALSYLQSIAEAAQDGNYALASKILEQIKASQAAKLSGAERKFALEVAFSKIDAFFWLMCAYLIVGVLALAVVFARLFSANANARKQLIAQSALRWLCAAQFAAFCAALALRGYLAGHAPWSNSYESLLYIAWSMALCALFFARRSAISLALSSVLAGCTLFVAFLGHSDPQIGNLAPVLSSIWLSIHVSVITASYGFLGLCALLGVFALLLFALINERNAPRLKNSIAEAVKTSEMAMILGLSLLTLGNFLGGVWANESWGRYWGWDSKETWALVSIIVYAAVLHARLWRPANSQLVFAATSALAFFSILMTYFGVNYFLTGMHSYAAGDAAGIPGYFYAICAALILLVILAAKNHLYSEKL